MKNVCNQVIAFNYKVDESLLIATIQFLLKLMHIVFSIYDTTIRFNIIISQFAQQMNVFKIQKMIFSTTIYISDFSGKEIT